MIIPFIKGDEKELGPIVNDAYFGKVPSDRLKVGDGVIYFKGDGTYRSKIAYRPCVQRISWEAMIIKPIH